MMKSKFPEDDVVRDGTESLAEPVDLSSATLPLNDGSNADLDEALMETFPASDPIASGRIA